MVVIQHYKIPLRVIDSNYNLLKKWDPEQSSRKFPSMYVMQKGNYIYTLNDIISALEQQINIKHNHAMLHLILSWLSLLIKLIII